MGRRRGGRLLAVVGFVALSAGLGLARFELEPQHEYGDTFWYARSALLAMGEPEGSATVTAARLMASEHGVEDYSGWVRAVSEDDPRYVAIFEARPLYPAIAAPLASVAGLRAGLLLASLLAGIVFGVAFASFLEVTTGSRLAAVAGVVLGFALPSGTWFAVMLSEGWMLALWTIGLASATRYIATGHRLWLVMTGAGIVALYATKAANGAVLVAALVVIGAGAFTLGARNRGRFAKLGIVAASLGIGQVLLTATLGLPGLQGTLQDLFTAHYTQPDVDNLLGRLVSRDLAVIGSLAGDTLRDPFLVVVALLLLVPLALRRATWAWMWLLAGMATCLTVAVHPITTEVPRLLAPIWVSAAMGGAVGVAWLSRRLQVAAQRPGDDVSADGTRLRDPRVEHAGD